MASSPIRVGILGLSTSSWAATAHLPYLASSPRYRIAAVCNSSVDSARTAIAHFKLDASTKAYGNPEDLAADADVDVVVCSVRVDRHLATVSPSIKAGKDVLVEWPLGKDLAQAEELLKLSRESKAGKAKVSLQGRFEPAIWKLKELIAAGKIGKVLNSTVVAAGGNGGPTEKQSVKYLVEKEVGGNLVTIHFGHLVDYVQQVLGTFETASGILANRRPRINLLAADGSVSTKDFHKTTEDTIFVHGLAKDDAPVTISLRGGKAFKGTPGLEWRIYGETGEIRLTASGPFLQMSLPDVAISVHNSASDEVEEIALAKDPLGHLAGPGRNVGRVYEAFADGGESVLADFEDAVERHRFIDTLYKENDARV